MTIVIFFAPGARTLGTVKDLSHRDCIGVWRFEFEVIPDSEKRCSGIGTHSKLHWRLGAVRGRQLQTFATATRPRWMYVGRRWEEPLGTPIWGAAETTRRDKKLLRLSRLKLKQVLGLGLFFRAFTRRCSDTRATFETARSPSYTYAPTQRRLRASSPSPSFR